MRIIVFNCGSSSLKYRLIELPGENQLAGGEAERVGPKPPSRRAFTTKWLARRKP